MLRLWDQSTWGCARWEGSSGRTLWTRSLSLRRSVTSTQLTCWLKAQGLHGDGISIFTFKRGAHKLWSASKTPEAWKCLLPQDQDARPHGAVPQVWFWSVLFGDLQWVCTGNYDKHASVSKMIKKKRKQMCKQRRHTTAAIAASTVVYGVERGYDSIWIQRRFV